MNKLISFIVFPTLLCSATLAVAHDAVQIEETTMVVISNERDAAEVAIPTISLETEPASLPLAETTKVRTEAKERAIPDDATIAVAEMREIANQNRSELCNDLREETKRRIVRH